MMRSALWGLALAAVSALAVPGLCAAAQPDAAATPASQLPGAGPAFHQPGRHEQNQCFLITQFEQWRDVDDKTIYIRVNINDYYRLDMSTSCPYLTYPDPHLITKTVGPDTVCSPIDWDLRVAPGTGPGDFAQPCIVKAMTKLTKAEADALPAKYKPR